MAAALEKPAYLEVMRSVVEKALGLLAGLLLAGMVVLVFSNVVARYFLNASIGWSEEVARFMFIWLAFLGAVVAFMRSEHLGLDAVVKALPAKVSRILAIVADLSVLGALVYTTMGGIEMTADSLASGWVSSAVPIPYGYVYLVVPISSALMLLEGLLKTAFDIRKALGSVARGGERPC